MDKNSNKISFGRELRQFREDVLGWSRERLAQELNLSARTIQGVEIGHQNLGAAALAAIQKLQEQHGVGNACFETQGRYITAQDKIDAIIEKCVTLILNEDKQKEVKQLEKILKISSIEAWQMLIKREVEIS